MMKNFRYIFFAVLCTLCASCAKFLDKSPESGLTTEAVFSKYENAKSFFDAVYGGTSKDDPTNPNTWYEYNIKTSYNLYMTQSAFRSTWEALTETADMGRINRQPIKYGQIESNLQWFTTHRVVPILNSMFKDIRICNVFLENMHLIADASQETLDDIRGQAFFVRAYCHFALTRLWGGMPYIDFVVGDDDQWDMERLSNNATYNKVAKDLDSAAFYLNRAGKMRRDPGPGQVGHLNDPQQDRPNGVAAKALKARALLYAASPLSNENGNSDWEKAATACWEAIKLARDCQYDLLPAAEYKNNFVGVKYTNEQIWAWNYKGSAVAYSDGIQTQLINNAMRNNSTSPTPECPTQNMVDHFETAWGDPLETKEDRDAAVALGHYNYQDPYASRDPRFYLDILYNTAPVPGFGTAKIYWENKGGTISYSQMLNPNHTGITQTGYYQAKYWNGQSVKNQVKSYFTDPLIRLGELYLDYAEAANEAYGPFGKAPGADLTALQALNLIRQRIGMVPVQEKFTADKSLLRGRIQNERIVELYGEGHHFYDIRRWKTAPAVMNDPSRKMDIEKVAVSAQYPTGYKYDDSQELPPTRQVKWTSDAMYYFPFPISEENKMKVFKPNKRW